MNIYEQISMLFADEFCATLILLNNEAVVLPAMLIFGGYNIKLLIATSAMARCFSAIANYMLGRVIYNIFIKFSTNQILQQRYDSFKKLFSSYGLIILLGCFIPVVGNIITLLAGIARYNLIYTSLYFAASSLVYYMY